MKDLIPKSNQERDELTFSPDDNEDTPESLILLSMEYENKTITSEFSKLM